MQEKIQKACILVMYKIKKDMDLARLYTQAKKESVLAMMVNGKMTSAMVKELTHMVMEVYIKDNG